MKNTFKYINLDENAHLNYYLINKNESRNFFYEFSKVQLSKNTNFGILNFSINNLLNENYQRPYGYSQNKRKIYFGFINRF